VRSLFVLSKQNIYQYWTSHSLKSYWFYCLDLCADISV
jgi:hypothetical protein